MRKVSFLVIGAAFMAYVVSPANAVPLVAGASSSAQTMDPMIQQVQQRTFAGQRGVGARRAIAARPGAVQVARPGGFQPGAVRVVGDRRQYYGNRGGSWGWGWAPVVGIGLLGAAAIAASQQPYYADELDCHWERQRVYDDYGNPRGTRRVEVCD